MAHHWLSYIDLSSDVHWPYNLDLFGGDIQYGDIMANYHWILNESGETCIVSSEAEPKFSELDLYLMGLIPEEEVSPIKIHDFEEKPGDYNYNKRGPYCGQEHNFTGTREVSIQDIISANGERVPSYQESQKDFNVAFVVIVPYGEALDEGFIDYLDLYKNEISEAWATATNNRSALSI